MTQFSDEVSGILDGKCHIFYKIDGTNGSVWFDEKDGLQCGSRNRVLSAESDNAGFHKYVRENVNLIAFFFQENNRKYILYGEWLVPHSLKTYRDDAWRKFYVFDVFDTTLNGFVPYDDYKIWLDEFGINYIPPLATIKNPGEEDLYRLLKNTGQFLVEDGKGDGEGLVIKNYGFENKFGRTTWAKMVCNEFKEIHHREMGAPDINATLTYEEIFVRDFLTSAFIQKEKSKIMNSHYVIFDGVDTPFWDNKMIPELLGRVWYEFIREELMDFLKVHKNPKINFRFLQQLVIQAIKKEIGL